MIPALRYRVELDDGTTIEGAAGIAEMCEMEEAHNLPFDTLRNRGLAPLVEFFWRAEVNRGRTDLGLVEWRRRIVTLDIEPGAAPRPTLPAL